MISVPHSTEWSRGVFLLTLWSPTLAEGYNIGLIIRQYIKPAAHITSQTSDRKIWKISQVLVQLYLIISILNLTAQRISYIWSKYWRISAFNPDTMTPWHWLEKLEKRSNYCQHWHCTALHHTELRLWKPFLSNWMFYSQSYHQATYRLHHSRSQGRLALLNTRYSVLHL